MTGARAEVAMDDAAVRQVFARLAALDGDQTTLMQKIGAQLRLHVDERFEDGKGPSGLPWKKSRRAQERGGSTLIESGRLLGSMTYVAAPRSVEIGTNVEYAAIHQFGGTIRAKTPKGLRFKVGGAWRRMMQVTLPARPFLGISQDDRDEMEAIVADHLAQLGKPA